jgi:hypothetical protein
MATTRRLQPCPDPEPGRPFVNRQAELQFVEGKLHVGRQGKQMTMAVICFWGASGIGKSWLLRELERCCRRNGPQLPGPHPTLTARLDMHPKRTSALWAGDKLDVRLVVQELWRQLAAQIGASVPSLGRASAEEYAGEFVRQVTAWLAYSTPVVMLDTMDFVVRDDEAAFFWLEEHLVEQLALTDRVLFVLASRGELRRWRRFQVRRRIDSYPLAAFDAATAGQEVKANAEVSEVLYRHAFGHPLATEYLGRVLEEQGIDPSTARAQDAEAILEPSLVRTILDEAMEYILDKVPGSLAQLAQHFGILRWINVEPLRDLAEGLGLIDAGRGDAHYLELIGQLQAHHLLYWNVDKASYEFDQALRRLLAHSLELDDTERFRKVHLAAYEYHRSHLERYPAYLARYVPEAAYHSAIASRSQALPQGMSAFRDWWGRFLSRQAISDPEPWKELFDVLRKDDELREALPAGEYDLLCSDARGRAGVNTGALTEE